MSGGACSGDLPGNRLEPKPPGPGDGGGHGGLLRFSPAPGPADPLGGGYAVCAGLFPGVDLPQLPGLRRRSQTWLSSHGPGRRSGLGADGGETAASAVGAYLGRNI